MMKKNFAHFLLLLLLFNLKSNAQNIIPKPNDIKLTEGKFSFVKGLDIKIIRGDEGTKIVNQQINDYFKRNKIPVIGSSSSVITINLLKENTITNDGYELNITPNTVTIVSSSNAGLFYGMQSLLQLINADTLKTLACMQIKDAPAFAYRGFQLDACHHFFKMDVIKQQLDAISKLKLNRFIWTLSNEQTWRIESKKNPKLLDSMDIADSEFYTQDEIKQIVQYAKERFIIVIPELNFTSSSFLDDTAFQYKKNVMDEVLSLFPSTYIAIGNQSFYAKDAETYLKTKGRKIIHTDNSSSKDDIILSYKNTTLGINAAKKGNDVIMAPHNLTALDNYQDWDDSKQSKSMLFLPLDKVYSFNPLAKIKDDKIMQHIIGATATLDTKFVTNEGKLSNQLYPRIYALAECFWTKNANKKNFKEFNARLEKIGYPGQITEKINLVKFK